MTSRQPPGLGRLVAGRAAALAAAPALVSLLCCLGAPAPQVLVRAHPEALRHGPAPEAAARALQPLLLQLLALPCKWGKRLRQICQLFVSALPGALRQTTAPEAAACALS